MEKLCLIVALGFFGTAGLTAFGDVDLSRFDQTLLWIFGGIAYWELSKHKR